MTRTVNGKKITVTYVCPPIPIRTCDWCAHEDGMEEDGKYGWGVTEEAAVINLVDSYPDDFCEEAL